MIALREIIIGCHSGDSGKSKILDERVALARLLDPRKRVLVYRFNGGANSGHSTFVETPAGLVFFDLHAAPCGLVSNSDIAIGPHVALDPQKFINEVKRAEGLFGYSGRILISERTGVLFGYHQALDGWREEQAAQAIGKKIGTTKTGIGPFYEDNTRRLTRIRFGDYVSDAFPKKLEEVLKLKSLELSAAGIIGDHKSLAVYRDELLAQHDPLRRELKPYVERLEYRMQEYLENGDHILGEGAQGTLLDVDMGSGSDVTSSHVLAQMGLASVGLPRSAFKVYSVEKIYPTRVGSGVLVTGDDAFSMEVAKRGGEKGVTTGRPRRCGYSDWVMARQTRMLHDCDGVFITRADVVQDLEMKACTGYLVNDLAIEEVPVDLGGVTPVYADRTYQWHLWDWPEGIGDLHDVSDPVKVHGVLKPLREDYLQRGFEGLPRDLQAFIEDHDRFVGRPTMGVSIGPARGETILRKVA